MNETARFARDMDDEALIYAFVMQKDIYDEDELNALQKEINRRKLTIDENYADKVEQLINQEEKRKGKEQETQISSRDELQRQRWEQQKKHEKEYEAKGLLYTTDTKKIAKAHNTIMYLLLFTCLVMAIIIIAFIAIGFKLEDPVLILIGFALGIFTIVFGSIITTIYNIVFGLFYDVRKIRMMMEKDRKQK